MKILMTSYAIWAVGALLAGCGYYSTYRGVWPSFWRVMAVVFWPIGIPLDYIFIVRPKAKRTITR